MRGREGIGASAFNSMPNSRCKNARMNFFKSSCLLVFLAALATSMQAAPPACQKVVLTGEVAAGQEWNADIGQGWRFRIMPIAAHGQPYSGWDLIVDRIDGAGDSAPGYPDALLLATPPYGSPSEREIGTTYGLRAQDAIAWQPRRFHFLTSAPDLARARSLFRSVMPAPAHPSAANRQATTELLNLINRASAGEFTILDARLVAGVADPPGFAAQWAGNLGRVPHTLVPAGSDSSHPATPLGDLQWIRFRTTLWLPASWRFPSALRPTAGNCAQ
jgi:hypothetical protein